MTIGSGFIYGLGIVSGLVLAGLAFLIYLALTVDSPDTTDPELAAATARAKVLAGRVSAGKNKVQDATATVGGIEPGE